MPGPKSKLFGTRLSAFSVILIMAAVMIVGAAMLPLLKIQYNPTRTPNSLSVSYSWNGASAWVIEQEVTSKIEGVLAGISGVDGINSASYYGSGRVDVYFKKGVKKEIARFEVASQIRQLYNRLPKGVSYPYINMSTSGSAQVGPVLIYTVNADRFSYDIIEAARTTFENPLSRIKGVSRVSFSGATPFEWVITFDPNAARAAGISGNDISSAFAEYFREDILGSTVVDSGQGETSVAVKLKNSGQINFDNIPIRNQNGRIYYLKDFARVAYQESKPLSYSRLNGLNRVGMYIYPERGINTLTVTQQAKEAIASLEESLPEGFSLQLESDSSEYLKQELNKITLRCVLSLAILLLFVFAVSRSLRYMLVIFITIVANILMAVIFYVTTGTEIHLYSLAGITISIGLIIDTSIIMIDHYSYYKDRRAFAAILGALLTTIAALCIIFFLPDNQKADLVDFAKVIIINLSVSLLIALLFIPSILEKLPVGKGITKKSVRGRRRVARRTRRYGRFIAWSRRHRWLYVVLFVLGFGLPIHHLPSRLGVQNQEPANKFHKVYNKTIGSQWYQNHKKTFETVLGGSYRLFSTATASSYKRREPERKMISVRAQMPQGCSVHQLNDIVVQMENFIGRFEQVDLFQTSVDSYNSSSISITFKKEFENTGFPLQLKRMLIEKAMAYGGATWQISGIDDQSFNNNVMGGDYKNYNIKFTGYNYDMLYRYAQNMVDSLSVNPRVSAPLIFGSMGWGNSELKMEYYLKYDMEKVVVRDIDLGGYFDYLGQQLYNSPLPRVFDGVNFTPVVLASSEKDNFDLWHIKNDLVEVDSIRLKLLDFGAVDRRKMGNDIYRNNQEYVLYVGFDFIGSYDLAGKLMKSRIDEFNDRILPIGYKASNEQGGWGNWAQASWRQFLLILLIATIIFFICSILFESFVKPLLIIMMIPFSFIGVFLVLHFLKIRFDQGVFASFVMLCGIVVNAGIYIVNEYNVIRSNKPSLPPLRVYFKAFNRKVVPIMLTIVSTVLGLIPFLINSKDDVFWYSFAIGVMGGMVFSIVALVVVLPVFMPFGEKRKTKTIRLP